MTTDVDESRQGPATLADFADLPDAMRDARRWIVWKAVPVTGKSKPRKVPYYADGTPRRGTLDSAEDLARFATLADAVQALQTGHYAGLGFALGPDGSGHHWQGIDLDGLSGRDHLRAIAEDLPGYTETSPSGDGRHAIGYGRDFAALGSNDSGLEAYSAGRFFTVTADCAGLHDPCDLADFVRDRVAPLHQLHGQHGTTTTQGAPGAVGYIDPQRVVDIRSALAFLPADARDTWLMVGMALHSTGAPNAYGLWVEWSQLSDKYRPDDQRKTWASFKPDGGVHVESIFAAATRAGWVNPAKKAPDAADDATTPAKPAAPSLRVVGVGDLRDARMNPPQFVLSPIIPRRHVTLMGGHGGTGKSTFALVIAAHVAAGLPWGPFTSEPANVLFVTLEDEPDLVRYRLALIVEAYQLDVAAVAARLAIVDGASTDASLAYESMQFGEKFLLATPAMKELEGIAAGAELIVVDNASDGFDGNANDPRFVRVFVRRMLGRLARANNAGVLLLAHIDKSAARHGSAGNSYTGTTAWHNSARSRLALIEVDGALELVHEKANLSARCETLRLRRGEHGVLFPSNTSEPHQGAALIEQADAAAILAAIVAATKDGENVPSGRTGPSTTQSFLATRNELPESLRGTKGRARFWRGLERLRREGCAGSEEYRNADRKLRTRIVSLKSAPECAPANSPIPPANRSGADAASPPICASSSTGAQPAQIVAARVATCTRCRGEGCDWCERRDAA